MDLSESWEAHASEWIKWARAPGHDSYWRFHRDQFLRLLPPPGRRTLDVGCGEGRLTRHLKSLGHIIVGIDSSPSLVAAARALDPSMDIRLADAARLPLEDASVDLVIAFLSLHDIDALSATVREIACVLDHGGRLCLAIVHPKAPPLHGARQELTSTGVPTGIERQKRSVRYCRGYLRPTACVVSLNWP